MDFTPNTSGLRRRVNRALENYTEILELVRAQVAGGEIARTDGTTYSYDNPLDVFGWKTDDLAKARGAYELAFTLAAADDEGELLEAATQLIAHHRETCRYRSGWNSSNPVANAITMWQAEGTDAFVDDLGSELSYIESKRRERAEKLAATVDALAPDALPWSTKEVITHVLVNPANWLAMDDTELGDLLQQLGLSQIQLAELVDEQDRLAAEAQAEKYARQQQAWAEKNAVRCVHEPHRYQRCDRTGRHIVKWDDGTEERYCGTHLKSATYNGLKVGTRMWKGLGDEYKQVTEVIDTKG